MPPHDSYIFVIVVYSLDDNGEPVEVHNHGWFSELSYARRYMQCAGNPVPGKGPDRFYEDPFECRWDYAMIERVSGGVMCDSEVVAHYQAEWYDAPDYEHDNKRTELANAMRRRRVRAKELESPPFDTSGFCGFAGF